MKVFTFDRKLSNAELERLADVAPGIPTSRILDQYGYDLVSSQNVGKTIVTAEDYELIKRFLGNLKDQTLSRSIHKVLTDLLSRLP